MAYLDHPRQFRGQDTVAMSFLLPGSLLQHSMKLPQKLIPWAEARRRHRLSDAHIQMARELGLNPDKLGKLDNHHQEPWKAPLSQFIERIYFKHFGRDRPEVVLSLEQIVQRDQQKKAARRERKLAGNVGPTPSTTTDAPLVASDELDDRGLPF